jgi:hypothetical protein
VFHVLDVLLLNLVSILLQRWWQLQACRTLLSVTCPYVQDLILHGVITLIYNLKLCPTSFAFVLHPAASRAIVKKCEDVLFHPSVPLALCLVCCSRVASAVLLALLCFLQHLVTALAAAAVPAHKLHCAARNSWS